jgi:hypothetical protein
MDQEQIIEEHLSAAGYLAGHGLGYCGGVCGWGVLVVLIGILQIGNLKLSRL